MFKRLTAWLTSRTTCRCSGWKLPRAAECFECSCRTEQTRELRALVVAGRGSGA